MSVMVKRLWASWKKEGPVGQKAKGEASKADWWLPPPRYWKRCKIRRLAGQTQEILRKSEAHQMRAQSFGPSGTKLESPPHKAGVGSSTKQVPSGAAPGWRHCAPWADQEQELYCGLVGTHWYPGVYCGYLWDDGAQLRGIVAFPNWSHAVLPCPIYIDTVH